METSTQKSEEKSSPTDSLIPKIILQDKSDNNTLKNNKDEKKETNEISKTDNEKQLEPVKYPRAVFSILPFEVCERYSFHAIRTLLTIYLCDKFNMDNDGATTIFHSFTMFAYFFPLFGAMIADSWIGKFKTVFYMSIAYVLGIAVIATGSLPVLFDVKNSLYATIFGLLLVAMGTGGIVPCISAFGGDQFVLPQQEKQLVEFFSIFYVAVNIGVLVSRFISPVFRGDIHCFGEDSCYSLAFAVPAILLSLSTVLFAIAHSRYLIKKPSGNMVVQVFRCVKYAISRKKVMKRYKRREHWLDYADDKYDKSFIDGVKIVLQVLVLYIPLPVFWALFDQEGSRWTLQAKQMNGQIGNFTIKPDQMQTLNPLFCLILIPLFDKCIYPAFAKYNLLKRPLIRIFFGGVLAACAFYISGTVEIALQRSYNKPPSFGTGELRIYNGFDCPIQVSFYKNGTSANIGSLDYFVQKDIRTFAERSIPYNLESNCSGLTLSKRDFIAINKEQSSYFFRNTGEDNVPDMTYFTDNTDESKVNGMPKLRVLLNSNETYSISIHKGKDIVHEFLSDNLNNQHTFLPDKYELYVDNKKIKNLDLKLGEVYTLLMEPKEDLESFQINLVKEDKPETLHMLWLFPQYLVMALGEVMFSVTGLEFSYSQAPASMKSVLQAFWLLTTAFGNMIVVIIAGVKISDSQSVEFFFFATLMLVTMIIFLLLSRSFKYADQEKKQDVVSEYQSLMELSQMK